MSAGTCENGNKDIQDKLVKVKADRKVISDYSEASKSCESETNSYVSLSAYKGGVRDCSPDKHKLMQIETGLKTDCKSQGTYFVWDSTEQNCYEDLETKCFEENGWSYWDGNSCEVNVMWECEINQPTKTWDFNDGKCNVDEVKVCNVQSDMSWNSREGTCDYDQQKDLQNQAKECLQDRSKIWKGNSCVNAN